MQGRYHIRFLFAMKPLGFEGGRLVGGPLLPALLFQSETALQRLYQFWHDLVNPLAVAVDMRCVPVPRPTRFDHVLAACHPIELVRSGSFAAR